MRSSRFWMGVGAIALGVVILAYLVYAVVFFFSDPIDDFTTFWTSLFYYPAASVLAPGYIGWFLLSILLPLLVVASLAKLVYYGVKRKKLSTRHLAVIGAVLVIAAVAQYFVPSLANSSVSYHEYQERVATLKQFQKRQQALQQGQNAQGPGEGEIRAAALQQLILADVLRQEATKYGVSVKEKEVNEFYKNQAEQNQGEDNLKKQIKEILGWSPAQFRQEIKLRLLQEKLNQKLATDQGLNKDKKKKADELLKRVKGGEDFATVAKDSNDQLAAAGGDVGTIKRGQTDPTIEEVAFKLNPGQTSDVIATEQGYVIIKVEEKPSADEVKVRQITVATESLNSLLPEQLKKAKISVYVHDLNWDKSLYTVQPKKKSTPQPQATGTATPAPAAPAQPAQ